MEDLNDDDEEFISSSDEEDAGISREDNSDKHRDVTQDETPAESEDMDLDYNTKHTNGLSRGNSESSGITKCGGVPVVLDMGSYDIKAGIAGEYEPSRVFRNVLGKWRPQVGEAYSEAYGEVQFGDDALTRHSALSLHYTLQGESMTKFTPPHWTLYENNILTLRSSAHGIYGSKSNIYVNACLAPSYLSQSA